MHVRVRTTNSARIFSSEPPTYLSRIWGPFTIWRAAATNQKWTEEQQARGRAPYLGLVRVQRLADLARNESLSAPRRPEQQHAAHVADAHLLGRDQWRQWEARRARCARRALRTTSAGNTREEKARRKMSENSLSRPPMPRAWKLKPRSKSLLVRLPAAPLSLSGASLCLRYMMLVDLTSWPQVAAVVIQVHVYVYECVCVCQERDRKRGGRPQAAAVARCSSGSSSPLRLTVWTSPTLMRKVRPMCFTKNWAGGGNRTQGRR